MSRRHTLRAATHAYDLANPPVGARINLGPVAVRLGVTITDMATACGISRSAVANLLSNKWPVKTPADQIRTCLLSLAGERGATDEELAQLFHAHTTHAPTLPAGPQPMTDLHGRALPRRPRSAAPLPPADPEDPDMLLPKQTLTPQARKHFKLFTSPFASEVVNDEMMFLGEQFSYVREVAWQCSQTSSFVAIVGESGAGKTTVLEDLESRLQRESRGVILMKPSVLGMEGDDRPLKSTDILHAVITKLDPSGSVPQTDQARTARARKLLASSIQAGNMHLVVVEEAHSLSDVTLKHLKRMHEVRDGRRPMLGILLLGQPELKLRLDSGLRNGTLREVAQRCEVAELLPLDADLKAYLERRVSAVGKVLADYIDDDAIEEVRQRLMRKEGSRTVSMCYPLAVNNLITKALNEAAATGLPRITRNLIKMV